MSARVLIVAGLPGSGKTPYLGRLRAEGWEIFDDFKADAHNDSPLFKSARRYDELIEALRNGRKCVVSDLAFCRTTDRQDAEKVLRAEGGDLVLDWQFFAKDPEQCANNIRRAASSRPPEPRLAKLKEFSSLYSAPTGAALMPILRDQ
jgi:hypothetical protein